MNVPSSVSYTHLVQCNEIHRVGNMIDHKRTVTKRAHSQQKIDRCLGLLLMVPIVMIIFGITGIPFIRALYLSFTDKVVGMQEQFIGFENYLSLFRDKVYWKSLNNTIIYTAGCIGAKLLLGILLAVRCV